MTKKGTKGSNRDKKRSGRGRTALLLAILLTAAALLTAAYYILDCSTGEEYVVDVGEISEDSAAADDEA